MAQPNYFFMILFILQAKSPLYCMLNQFTKNQSRVWWTNLIKIPFFGYVPKDLAVVLLGIV